MVVVSDMQVTLIGRLAPTVEMYDGQTVKTRNLYRLLNELDEVSKVNVVDTLNYKKKIFQILFKTIYYFTKSEYVFLCVSIKGRRFYFPFLYTINKIFKKKICHSLIGGRLEENIKENPSWKKYVNSFYVNLVESKELVSSLNVLGVFNAVYMPNFKNLSLINENEIVFHQGKIFRFCTFSRVQEKKGIEDAIKAIREINKEYKENRVYLDIYGPIDGDYRVKFNCLVENNKDYVRYMGCVDANESVSIVKNYYMLLFPTRYFNEGVPGTIIDAMCAGVPVLARRWHYCDEMINDRINGLVYDFEKPNELIEKIKYSINNEELINSMKVNCLQKAKEYTFESAVDQIKGLISGEQL